jgi:hypothetical protein
MSGPDFEDTIAIAAFRQNIMSRLPELAAAQRRRQK